MNKEYLIINASLDHFEAYIEAHCPKFYKYRSGNRVGIETDSKVVALNISTSGKHYWLGCCYSTPWSHGEDFTLCISVAEPDSIERIEQKLSEVHDCLPWSSSI